MVYFIQGKETKKIKIGFSASKFVADRLKDLQIGSPDILEVIAIWPDGTKWDERSIHSQFLGLWSHGEWFVPAQDLLEYIEDIKQRYPQNIEKRLIHAGKKMQELFNKPKRKRSRYIPTEVEVGRPI